MSSKKSKRTQKLGSSRRNHRNRDTEEKINDDGIQQVKNEEHEVEQSDIHPVSEKQPVDADHPAIDCSKQCTLASELCTPSQSHDCQDLSALSNMASKRKMGSTRKNNRGFKFKEVSEEDSATQPEASEGITDELEAIAEVTIKEKNNEDFPQPGLPDCPPSQILHHESSIRQKKHLAHCNIIHTENVPGNDEHGHLQVATESQTMVTSYYEFDQSTGTELEQELISQSLDLTVLTPTHLPSQKLDDFLDIYNQKEMIYEQADSLPNTTDQERKTDQVERQDVHTAEPSVSLVNEQGQQGLSEMKQTQEITEVDIKKQDSEETYRKTKTGEDEAENNVIKYNNSDQPLLSKMYPAGFHSEINPTEPLCEEIQACSFPPNDLWDYQAKFEMQPKNKDCAEQPSVSYQMPEDKLSQDTTLYNEASFQLYDKPENEAKEKDILANLSQGILDEIEPPENLYDNFTFSREEEEDTANSKIISDAMLEYNTKFPDNSIITAEQQMLSVSDSLSEDTNTENVQQERGNAIKSDDKLFSAKGLEKKAVHVEEDVKHESYRNQKCEEADILQPRGDKINEDDTERFHQEYISQMHRGEAANDASQPSEKEEVHCSDFTTVTDITHNLTDVDVSCDSSSSQTRDFDSNEHCHVMKSSTNLPSDNLTKDEESLKTKNSPENNETSTKLFGCEENDMTEVLNTTQNHGELDRKFEDKVVLTNICEGTDTALTMLTDVADDLNTGAHKVQSKTEVIVKLTQNEELLWEEKKDDDPVTLDNSLQNISDVKLTLFEEFECAESLPVKINTDPLMTSVKSLEEAMDDQEPIKQTLTIPFQEEAKELFSTFSYSQEVEKNVNKNMYEREEDVPLTIGSNKLSTDNLVTKEDNPNLKQQTNSGPTENLPIENFEEVSSQQLIHSEFSSEKTEQDLKTNTVEIPGTENSDSRKDDDIRSENGEKRDEELHAQNQTNKKSFDLTQELQGEHQGHAKGQEEEWKDGESTDIVEHEIVEPASTSNLLAKEQNAKIEVSSEVPTLTTEQNEIIKSKAEESECGRIVTPPVLSDVVFETGTVTDNERNDAKQLGEPIDHHEKTDVDDTRDVKVTCINNQEMAPAITEDALTDHASPEANVYGIESTENESTSQIQANSTSIPEELQTETQDSVNIPISKENIDVVIFDQDHNITEDHLVEQINRDSELGQFATTQPVVRIQKSVSAQDNVVTENFRFNISGQRRKMGSTQKGTRGRIPKGENIDTDEAIKEEKNIQEKALGIITAVSEDNCSEAEALSINSESYQSTERHSEHSGSLSIKQSEADVGPINAKNTENLQLNNETSTELLVCEVNDKADVLNTTQNDGELEREDEDTVLFTNMREEIDITSTIPPDVAEHQDTEVQEVRSKIKLSDREIQNKESETDHFDCKEDNDTGGVNMEKQDGKLKAQNQTEIKTYGSSEGKENEWKDKEKIEIDEQETMEPVSTSNLPTKLQNAKDSLIGEMECELKKSSLITTVSQPIADRFLESTEKACANQLNISESSQSTSDQSKTSHQVSPSPRRKIGSTRKTGRSMLSVKKNNAKEETEQDKKEMDVNKNVKHSEDERETEGGNDNVIVNVTEDTKKSADLCSETQAFSPVQESSTTEKEHQLPRGKRVSTSNLPTKPHNAITDVSIDVPTLTSEQKEECERIYTSPILSNAETATVISDEVNKAEGLVEPTGQHKKVDDARNVMFTYLNEQKMPPVITDDHAFTETKHDGMESTENESTSQVHTDSTYIPVKLCPESQDSLNMREDIKNIDIVVSEQDLNVSKDHLQEFINKEPEPERFESTEPVVQTQENKLAQYNVISISKPRKKMGSTRKSLRVKIPEDDQMETFEIIKKRENIQEHSIPLPEKKCSEAETLSIVSKTYYQSTKETESLVSLCNVQSEADMDPATAEDNGRKGTKSATAENNVIIDSLLHATAKTLGSEEPQNHNTIAKDSLLSEIETELKMSYQSSLITTDPNVSQPIADRFLESTEKACANQLNVSESSQSTSDQSKATRQVSPSPRRKLGSTRKTGRSMLSEKKNNAKEETEQDKKEMEVNKNVKHSEDERETEGGNDNVIVNVTEDTKKSADLCSETQAFSPVQESSTTEKEHQLPRSKRKFGSRRTAKDRGGLGLTPGDYDINQRNTDAEVPKANLLVCDPYSISDPGSTSAFQPVSEYDGMEAGTGTEEVQMPIAKPIDLPPETGLAAFSVRNTGGTQKIDFEQWNEPVPDFGQVVYNVLMVGNSSVGKTSFIRRLQSGHFNSDHCATIGVDTFVQTVTLGNKTVKLYVWDTAGQERYHSITRQVFHKAQGLLLVYDITSSQSFHAVRDWISQVQERAPNDVIMMLLGNKNDCAKREVQLKEGEDLSKEYGIHFMECSAATGENILECMKTIAWLLVKQGVRKEKEYTILEPKPPKKKSGCC